VRLLLFLLFKKENNVPMLKTTFGTIGTVPASELQDTFQLQKKSVVMLHQVNKGIPGLENKPKKCIPINFALYSYPQVSFVTQHENLSWWKFCMLWSSYL